MQSTTFYVGATFSRYAEARAVIDALTLTGRECTHDWTRTRAFGSDGHPLPGTGGGYTLERADAAAHAVDDIAAVQRAEVCVFLGEQASLGWPVEFGLALAASCPLIYVVAPFKWTVFLALPTVYVVESAEQALMRLGADHSPALVLARDGKHDGGPA
jgi:hypothetical protein